MTLAFSTQLNKVPTFFVEKINLGLWENSIIPKFEYTSNIDWYYTTFPKYPTALNIHYYPKIHTIRVDEKDRWKAGMDIHFVINNRTKNRYQFAPVVKCISTQKIKIHYWYNTKTEEFDIPKVYVDNKELTAYKVELLAVRDGFENSEAFFAYFNTNFTGKIIHWTNTKY